MAYEFKKEVDIKFFLDFHNHSVKKNIFICTISISTVSLS